MEKVTTNYSRVFSEMYEIIKHLHKGFVDKIPSKMIELIENHRLYEANSKAVTTQDTMLDNSVNQIGRLS